MGAVAVRDLLLLTTLEAAVPLWIHRVRGYSPEHRAAREKACGDIIAEKGDVIQYKSKKKGESANAFNHLAEGLALLSFVPGGVKFCGLHWRSGL